MTGVAREIKKIKKIKNLFFIFKPMLPPGYLAVWPAIGNIYTNVLFYNKDCIALKLKTTKDKHKIFLKHLFCDKFTYSCYKLTVK